ncbi:protein kinase domain-containing protein [Rubritalea tangerina]|uniref:Protein kinase n=1 Tax=Rubritalea tangerina TaxID=430798 RepID=A0ABW4ZEG1_9BACT
MSDERYEIRGKIGQGGVGAVYRAYDTQLRREVAIKRVLAEEGEGYEDPEIATKNLLKEATALSSVQHPHICTVYDAGVDKEGPFVVMELINGKTLDEMVERGTLTFDDFREVAIQSQEAMIAAQDLDLVHRDLKPSNVMVCWLPSGRFQVKLVDFGLAKFSAKPSLQTIDHGDAVFGSIFFMAPEQFERTPLDRRTDMYALGCMYYYSLAGTYPFNGDSAPQVMAGHLQNSVQPLHELRPDLPHWVCDWVMWHIARNMDDRPESARVALEKFLTDETAAAQHGGTLPVRTGPQLVIPTTSPQPNRPAAAPSTTVNTQTAPQTITPPGGQTPVTASQTIRPASVITGGTAIQPARPAVASNPTITPASGPTAVTGVTAPQNTTPDGVTEAAPEGEGPTLAPDLAAAKKGLSSKQKLMISAGLGVAIIVLGGVLIGKSSTGSENKKFNELVEQVADLTARDIPTTEDDMKLLLDALADDTLTNRNAVFQRMVIAKAEGGYSIDKMVLSYATAPDTGEEDRKNLAIVIGKRGDQGAIKGMLKWATKNPNDPAAQIAIDAANKTIEEENFTSFIQILGATRNNGVRSSAEKALANVISKSRRKSSLAEQLVGAFDASVDEKYRLAMIRLLGNTGTDQARKTISESLASSNTNERIAAATAFGAWPTDEPFDDLLNAFENEDTVAAKNAIFKSAINLLSAKRKHDQDELGNRWLTLAGYSTTNSQKSKIITEAVNARADWSPNVLKFFTSQDHDDRIQSLAEKGLDKLNG